MSHWRLPAWLLDYRNNISELVLSEHTLYEYALFHDCGKPRTRVIDDHGKQHFPNHARESAKVWRDIGGSEQVARLIEMDMDIHCLKSEGIEEFCQRPEAVSLLLAGLAEVHSNATMFGGQESVSFKIKWKHIDKRGQAICQHLFG